MSKSVWIAFVLHSPVVIACLFEHVVTFNIYTKLELIVSTNMTLLAWQDKIWFSLDRSNTSSNSLVARLLEVLLVVLLSC